MTFDEILDEIYEGVEYEPLPEREKSAELFIKIAIYTSETYELGVKIVQHYSHISVNFFNSSGCMGFMKHIFRFADDIPFLQIKKAMRSVCLSIITPMLKQGTGGE